MILLIIFSLLIGFVLLMLGYKYLKKIKYWDKKGVPSTKSWPIIKDIKSLILKNISMPENVINIYNMFPNERYFGTWQFMTPVLVIRDLDVIKQIAIKDFDHFTDHQGIVAEEDPIISKNLFLLKGQEWHDMRSTLSPAFTSAKMKAMFVLMCENAEEFVRHYLKQTKDVTVLEMKDTFTRYTNDVIASIAFGMKCNSLSERNNEFYTTGKYASDISGLTALKLGLTMMLPIVTKFFKIRIFPHCVYEFFGRIVKDVIEVREKENIYRPDMIHLLMQAKKGKLNHETRPEDDEDAGFATVLESSVHLSKANPKKELSFDDITAQAMLFFFAGYDTASTALCFMCHELAANTDIQKKLQQEIDEMLKIYNGKLVYEALTNMKYLDMVVSESLRRWHPAIMADRTCTKSYIIQPKNLEEKLLSIEKGDIIVFPYIAIHMDPKYYPDPEKFDPERFSDENKPNLVPGSYLPFGIGPRNCIGSRFAIIEIKVLIVHLLSKFEILVVEKTQIPLKLSRNKFKITAENGFWLGIKAR